jgi:iron complex transport system substrate-binding protein
MNIRSTRNTTTVIARTKFCHRRAPALCAGIAAIFLLISGGPVSAQARVAQVAPQANVSATRTFTDEIGRHVKVPAKINRIVSLAPNLTEIIFALKEENNLAGDTDFCDYPPEAAQKPHVGGPVNPNLEEVVKLRPDVILATSINRRETVAALDRLGLPVYITDPHSVNEMIASVARLGSVLGAEKSAARLAENLRARLAEVDRRLAHTAPRSVLFVVWTDPLISIGSGTFIADALRRAGARSIVETDAEWPHVNMEDIVRLQPEVIVFATAHAGDTQREIAAMRLQPGWRDVNAMRSGSIVTVSDAINRPAPRMVEAVEQLARSLHPEAFVSRAAPPPSSKPIIEEACACAR